MRISNVKMLPISNANSNLGLATLVLATLATLATFAASALPLPWRADWPDAKPVETLVHRGTDVELQPLWRINKEPADTNGWTFTTWCQTNAVGPWFGPLPGAFFSHTNDVGAAFYNVMVRAQTPGGAVNYTAFARFRMLDSPGFTPGELPLPAKSIDFADVATYNAPWLLPDATNDLARAGDIAPTITNTVTKQFVESLGIDAGTTNYADLGNKPAVNGVTLAGDKTSAALGLASAADVQALQAFYLEEKRKTDPRFGVATNVSVVIGEDGNRYEVVTEEEFIPTVYGQGVYAKEIYLAPSVNAIGVGDNSSALSYTQKIVCYGNITSIPTYAFLNAYQLKFLSLAGVGQTDAVANGNVDFSMCSSAILVVIPDVYYQDETSAFWRWADYVQDAGGINYLRMCNFAKASNPRRNPYIVETSYALYDGTQEKIFITPDYQWDVKWAKRYDEIFSPDEGEIGSVALNDICGAAKEHGYNYQATLSGAYTMMGRLETTGVDCSIPSFDSHYGGVTIEVVVSGFNGYAANVDFGGMKIEGRTLRILDPSGNEVSLSANSIGESLTSFVFRASRAGASFQWLLNLGRAVFTTPEEGTVLGDYDFVSDGMHIACDNGQAPFYFYALRIYNAILTDAQIMEHARLDAERFNLMEEY